MLKRSSRSATGVTIATGELILPKKRSIFQEYYRYRYLFILLLAALIWTIIFKYKKTQ